MKVIGLTGGIATGKSTVSDQFKNKYGCVVIDADTIAHGALNPGETPYNTIKSYCKERMDAEEDEEKKNIWDIFQEEGSSQAVTPKGKPIDRTKLGKLVFEHTEVRQQINKATHSWIFKKILKSLYDESRFYDLLPNFLHNNEHKNKIVILDVPLLFEAKVFTYLTKKNIVVYTDKETQLKRLLNRNKELSEEDAKNRINSQMPIDDKKKLGDYIIDNSKDFKSLDVEISKAYEWISKL